WIGAGSLEIVNVTVFDRDVILANVNAILRAKDVAAKNCNGTIAAKEKRIRCVIQSINSAVDELGGSSNRVMNPNEVCASSASYPAVTHCDIVMIDAHSPRDV